MDSDEYQGTYVKRILRESNKDVKKAHMEPCKEIYNTIASDELKDEDRQQIIENLIKFYVSHTYEEEVESIGFMTCKAGATTYQIENINGAEGKSLVDDLRQRINTKAHFEFTKDRTQNQMNIIFDLDEYELQDILEGYPELRE